MQCRRHRQSQAARLEGVHCGNADGAQVHRRCTLVGWSWSLCTCALWLLHQERLGDCDLSTQGHLLNSGTNCCWCIPELAQQVLRASKNKVRSALAHDTPTR